MKSRFLPALILAWIVSLTTLRAHEIRPAYLQIDETAPGAYDVLWKMPRVGDRVLDVRPEFDCGFVLDKGGGGALLEGFVVYHHHLTGKGSLAGTTLSIRGLSRTTIDVLANLNLLDGQRQTFLLHPTSPEVVFPREPSKWGVAWTYTVLGIEHILLGIDHLLFVLALVLLVKGWRRLLATITAFTVSHSITLAAATLGYVHVPGPPVEACIALSIVFVAAEIIRARRNGPGLAERAPWLVAFSFGLLHGLGFAGALSAVGLPPQAIPVALLFFNIGVELGQLAFITVVLAVMAAWRKLPIRVPQWSWRVAPYSIGGMAMFWMIQRIDAF